MAVELSPELWRRCDVAIGLVLVACGAYGLLLYHGLLPVKPAARRKIATIKDRLGVWIFVCYWVILLFGLATAIGWMHYFPESWYVPAGR